MRARVSLALPMTEHRSFPTGAKMLNPKEGKNKRKQRWHSLCNPCLTFTRETAPTCLPCLPSHCHLTRGRSTYVGPPPLGVSRPAAARDGRKHRLLPDTQPAFLGRVGRCGAAGLRRGSDAAHSSTSVPCKPKSSPPPPPQTALLNFISSLFGALSTDARHKAQISNFCFRLQRCQLEAPDFTSPAQKYPQPHSAGPAGDT